MAAPSTEDTRAPRLAELWDQMRELRQLLRQHKPDTPEHQALLSSWSSAHDAVLALKEELEGG